MRLTGNKFFLQVTERGISELRGQLDELEQLQGAVSRQLPGGAPGLATARGEPGGPARLRDLLECPVCMEEMKPPKKIFQCSNGHVICELCKNNPEVKCLIINNQLSFSPPGSQLPDLQSKVPRAHSCEEHCGGKTGSEHFRERRQRRCSGFVESWSQNDHRKQPLGSFPTDKGSGGGGRGVPPGGV